jgi:hypothetical protein
MENFISLQKYFMIRKFILFISIVILACPIGRSQNDGGYVNSMSVTEGDTLRFYISTSVNPFTLNIYQIGTADTLKLSYANVSGGLQAVPDSSFLYGCGWAVSKSIVIPADWAPGIYRTKFPDATGNHIKQLLFIVRGKTAGASSQICVSLSENTDNAYNEFGGCSLYSCSNCSSCRSYKVSFNRPLADNSGLGKWGNSPVTFYKWLLNNNLTGEFVSQYDLFNNSSILNNFKILVIAGHSEYWSLNERNNIQNFLNAGGKILVLSGNTCGYQNRYENNGRTLVCYKDANLDPYFNHFDSLVTANWWYPPLNYPENILLGAGYQYSGYVNLDNTLPFTQGFGDYAVNNSQHWIFRNTGVQNGNLFGRDGSNAQNFTVGYENDCAFFTYVNGVPFTTGIDGSPLNYRILGISPAANDTTTFNFTRHATMGIYTINNGGSVFNAASINWVIGLTFDTTVQRITLNVLKKFMENRLPPDIIRWNPFTLIPQTIHNENLMINTRNVSVEQDSFRFSIKAVDPYNGQLNYFWILDSSVVSTDSFYLFHPTLPIHPSYNLTAYVYNSKDTSSISWFVDAHTLGVELTSFTANADINEVIISWKTATELNNIGFQIQRSKEINTPSEKWDIIGIIKGNGTTTNSSAYSFTDKNPFQGKTYYRIKQMDSDGAFIIYGPIEVNYTGKIDFALEQNYPNPFNPNTVIKYSIPKAGDVSIKLYNELGAEVAILLNEFREAGQNSLNFSSIELKNKISSGIYFYTIKSGQFTQTRKMVLMK